MRLPERKRNEGDSEYFKRLGAHAKTQMLEVARRCDPCIVCGAQLHFVGLFFPYISARFCSVIGLDEVFVYAVCENHSQGAKREIENALLADLAVAVRNN